MAEPLHLARCVVHPAHEAAGRCISCELLYCRECVTEHEGRLRCARCLERAATQDEAVHRGWWAAAKAAVRLAGGILAAWLFFLTVGELLLAIPKGPATKAPEVEASE